MNRVTSSQNHSNPGNRDIFKAVLADNQADASLQPGPRQQRRLSASPPRPGLSWLLGLFAAGITLVSAGMIANMTGKASAMTDFDASENPLPQAPQLPPQHHSPQQYESMFSGDHSMMADLLGMEVKTIVIDPGHGGIDPGATGPAGLMEKEVTLAVARRLQERLQKYGQFRIVMTREDDRKISLKQRASLANQVEADLFISIHVNYLPVEPVTFIETYYFGPQADSDALALAQRENQDSDYPLSEFKPLIAKISNVFKQQESRTLAASIQTALFRNMHRDNQQLLNAGIKTAPFVVLLDTEMPSVLAELTCISNREEEKKLATDEYRDRIARHLEQGIVTYLGSRSGKALITGAKPHGKKKARDAEEHG